MGLFGKTSKPKNVEIDYDKLADAIVKAHNRIKEQERIEQCDEQEQLEAKWNKVIHYKEYPETKNIALREIREAGNTIAMLFSIIFFKKKNAEDDDIVTFGLMRMALSLLFGTLKVILYIAAAFLLLLAFYSFVQKFWIVAAISIPLSFLAFLFARLFRIAELEADNMYDKQSLIGILSTLSAFLALIISTISLVVTVLK